MFGMESKEFTMTSHDSLNGSRLPLRLAVKISESNRVPNNPGMGCRHSLCWCKQLINGGKGERESEREREKKREKHLTKGEMFPAVGAGRHCGGAKNVNGAVVLLRDLAEACHPWSPLS